jgi:pilus assembly protein CpaB
VSNRRTLMAALAVVLAAVAFIGVFVYVSGAEDRAQEKAGLVDALVATADIARGTTGEQALQAGLVRKEKVARTSVPPTAVLDTNDLMNKVASGRIDTKQFITATSFVDKTQGGGGTLADAIASESLVAVTVSVDAEHGVAGQIAPGDRVNLAVTGGANGQATYRLEKVKVLAVGATTVGSTPVAEGTATTAGTGGSGLLTFEVTAADALVIISANHSGDLYLVLLPPSATAGSPASTTTTTRR